MVLVGVGLGGLFPLCTVVVQNTTPRQDMANALSGLRFFQNLAGAASVAVSGAIINSFAATEVLRTHDPIEALCYGIHWGFLVTTSVAAVPVLVCLTLRPIPSLAIKNQEPKKAPPAEKPADTSTAAPEKPIASTTDSSAAPEQKPQAVVA